MSVYWYPQIYQKIYLYPFPALSLNCNWLNTIMATFWSSCPGCFMQAPVQSLVPKPGVPQWCTTLTCCNCSQAAWFVCRHVDCQIPAHKNVFLQLKQLRNHAQYWHTAKRLKRTPEPPIPVFDDPDYRTWKVYNSRSFQITSGNTGILFDRHTWHTLV